MSKEAAARKKKIINLVGKYLPKEVNRREDGSVITPRYETGILPLDALLNGGLPKGHMIGLSSEEGGGKSTLMAQAAGNIIEKYGKRVYYFDVEGGLTPELLGSMGYGEHLYHPDHNPEGQLFVLRATYIQEIAEVLPEILDDPDTALVVIDSTTMTDDRRQAEDEALGLNKNSVGSHARMWSEASRRFSNLIAGTNVTMVLIHQAREDLSNFFVQTVASRGRALKHAVSVDIWGTIGKYLDIEGNEVKGRRDADGVILRLTTTKNRLTAPHRQVIAPLFFGRGVSNKWAYRAWLENHDVVDEVTGEVTKALEIKGGGYATLNLPSGQYKLRGAKEINEAVDTHIEEIMKYIEDSGGFDKHDEEFADKEN